MTDTTWNKDGKIVDEKKEKVKPVTVEKKVERAELWTKDDLLNSALDHFEITVKGKTFLCRRIKKKDEIEIQRLAFEVNPDTGKLKNIDYGMYQILILEKGIIKPELSYNDLLEIESSLANEIFVTYQDELGLEIPKDFLQ